MLNSEKKVPEEIFHLLFSCVNFIFLQHPCFSSYIILHLTQFIQFTKAEKKKRVNQDSCIKHVCLFKDEYKKIYLKLVFL